MLLTLGRGLNARQSLTPIQIIVDTAPKTIALFGDSISAQSTNVNGNFTTHEAYGYPIALNYLTNQRYNFEHINNQAVGGGNSYTLDARKETDLASSPADIIFVQVGTNDVDAGTTAAQIQTNLSSIYDYITNTLGKTIVATTVLPRTGMTATQKQTIQDVNAWIMAQANADIIPINAYDDFNDGNDEPKAGYTNDGLHPSIIGSFSIAKSINNTLSLKYGSNPALDPNATGNFLANSDFSGTAGIISANFTGQAADGWKFYGYSNGTRTASKNPDGSQKVTTTIASGNSTSESIYVELDGHITSGYSTGDSVYGEIDLEVISGQNVQWIGLEIHDKGTQTLYYIGLDKRDATTYYPLSAMGRGIIRTPKFTVQPSNTQLEYRLRIEMNASSAPASLDLNIHGACMMKE